VTEQASFRHGGVTYPLPVGTGQSLLRDADPALYWVQKYLESILQSYMGARLVEECAACGVTSVTKAVGYTIPYDPASSLQELAIVKWPLLAIWRQTGKYKWRTVGRMETVATWKVVYVLPPLTAGQRERLTPILNSVPKILLNRIENKFDPAFEGGANFAELAGVDSIDMTDDGWGSYDLPETQKYFPAWMGTITVVERDEDMPDTATGSKYDGADIVISVGGDGVAPLDLVSIAANVPDPTEIAGLETLYRADIGVTVDTTGTFVTNWADQSINDHPAAPPLAANEPFLAHDAETDRPVARFDGANSYLQATDVALGNDNAKTLVVLFRLWDVAARSSLALVTDGTANGTVGFEANTASSAGGLFGLSAGGSTYDTQFPTNTDWHIAIIRVSASTPGSSISATTRVSIDDRPAVLTRKSGSGNWSSLAASTTFALGALSSALAATAAHADIGVAMTFSSNLSDSDAAKAAAFCKQWLAGTV
jgi:hypothetical protein